MVDGFYLNYNEKHLYLLDSKRRPIECLTNLISNFNHINIFNSTGEMSFVIYYDDETKHIYDLFIENVTHLRLEDYGEFVVFGTPETNEGEVRYKTVTCKDEEFMLNKRLLTLVNNSASWFSGVLWTTDTSMPCVMREFFKEVPSWSIGTVDEEIDTTKKSFRDIKKQNMLKFTYENIEEAFDCIPFFNSLNRTISFKKTKNAVDDTGIVLSFSNFINSLTKETINDMFCTRMYVEGGNLDIRRANADGRNYVYSYEKFYGLMSNSLSTHLQQWIATCDDNEEVYRNTFAEWSEEQTKYEILKAQYDSLSPTHSKLNQEWAYANTIYGDGSVEEQEKEDIYWDWVSSSGFSGLWDRVYQAKTLADSKKSILDGINSNCKISNFLTSEDLVELDQFETEGSYKQECFAYIKGMSEEDKGGISQLLKDYANEEIQRCNAPRYTWDVNLSNFCTIEGCEYFAESLDVGKYITLFDDVTREAVKLIVVKIETDKENPKDLKLSFSDRMTGHSYYPKLNELLNNAIKNMDDIETTNVRIDDLETEIGSTNANIDIVSSRVDYLYQNPPLPKPATNTSLGAVQVPPTSSVSVALQSNIETGVKAGDIDIKLGQEFKRDADGTIRLVTEAIEVKEVKYYTTFPTQAQLDADGVVIGDYVDVKA